MTNFYKLSVSITFLLTIFNSYSSVTSLQDLAADKTIEALLSQTSQEKLSTAISSTPEEIQQRLKGKVLEKYKDVLNKVIATQSKELADGTYPIGSVAVSPDGKYALTGLSDDAPCLWNLSTTRSVLWDLVTGTCIKEFRGNDDFAKPESFSPDGKYCLTTSPDKMARVCPVAHLKVLNLEQLLFIIRSIQGTINLNDKGTQHLLNSLSSTINPYGALPSRDYGTNPLVKAYIDLKRKQLFQAVTIDDVDTVKALIKEGFNTTYITDKLGNNMWHYAFQGYIKDGIAYPSQKVLAYLLELEGSDKALKKPNKAGIYPFAVGLIYHKDFTKQFIKELSQSETKKSYSVVQ